MPLTCTTLRHEAFYLKITIDQWVSATDRCRSLPIFITSVIVRFLFPNNVCDYYAINIMDTSQFLKLMKYLQKKKRNILKKPFSIYKYLLSKNFRT